MISCFELFPLGMVDGINKSGLLAKQLQKYSLHVCKSIIGQSLGFFNSSNHWQKRNNLLTFIDAHVDWIKLFSSRSLIYLWSHIQFVQLRLCFQHSD